MDEVSRLPVEDTPPDGEEAPLTIKTLKKNKEAARQSTLELHHATHVGVTCCGSCSGMASPILEAKRFALR